MLRILRKPEHNLKDIRPDLRERLRAAVVERDQLRPRLQELEGTIALLEKLMEQENRRFKPAETAPSDPLDVFLLEKMRLGISTKESLRGLAEEAGYDVDGRSIHATLVNLIKSGRAVEIGEGQYGARAKE
jgi:hypothetical protein